MKSRTTASTAAPTSASPTRRPPLFSAAASPIFLLPLVPCAAASALFALQSHADAGIIYSGTLNISDAGGARSIDLNGGGNDFQILAGSGAWSLKALGANMMLVQGESGGGLAPRKLAAGYAIGPLAGPTWGSGYHILKSADQGVWTYGKTGFAGVRLALGGGNFDYAWIRMQQDISGTTILGYAYDDTANEPIQAGQTTAAPEPSAAALLALAGAGAAFLRRRRAGS